MSVLESLTTEWQAGIPSLENSRYSELPSSLWNERAGIVRDMEMRVFDDPIVQRLVKQQESALCAGSSYAPSFTQPWQAYAEQKVAAFAMVEWSSRTAGDPKEFFSYALIAGSLLAPSTATYLWTNKVHELVRSAPPPRCLISSVQMPYAVLFFSNEGRHEGDNSASDWAILMRAGADGVALVIPNRDDKNGKTDYGTQILPGLLQFPDALLGTSDEPLIRPIGNCINRIAFIRESIMIETHRDRLSKADRRELEKVPASVAPTSDPTIFTCVLRRQFTEYRKKLEDSGHIEWKHQWWVCGHERNQYCPSTKTHKKIWVAPYVKGPPDCPFMQKVYAVAR